MRNNGNTNIVSWSISAGREWGKSTKRDQRRKREKTRDRDTERKIEMETETPGMCVSDARANSENGQWESALGTLNLRSESFYYNTGLLLYLTFPTANSTVLCHKRDERASERANSWTSVVAPWKKIEIRSFHPRVIVVVVFVEVWFNGTSPGDGVFSTSFSATGELNSRSS